jgi:hypothetical protein
MRFIKFLIGWFLIVGSVIFGFMLAFSAPFVIVGGAGWVIILWGVVAFIAFIGGVYLVIHH